MLCFTQSFRDSAPFLSCPLLLPGSLHFALCSQLANGERGGCKGRCRGRSRSAGPHLCSGLLAISQMFSPVCSEMCIQEENVGCSVDRSILSAPSTPVSVSTNGSLPRQERGPSCLCPEAQPGEVFSPGRVSLYVGELVKQVPLMTSRRRGRK